ncbi:hypothetical protein IEO21_07126 [Rhodonia placenta]|uniref:Uncharacterized protein n=1 Tax=Rhodonia placenta TaxID=104341 RepID=A0A8H7NYZ0_9APHY|nr:hypothetical protein IEO21_07126 [Postia placenta]
MQLRRAPKEQVNGGSHTMR